VSPRTIQRHLKPLGFRLGDFCRFPRDRNKDKVIEMRREFDKEIYQLADPEKALRDAIYIDEMKLSRQTSPKAWSIAGWIPEVVCEFHNDNPELVTLILAVSATIRVLHFEIVTGSVTHGTVRNFCKTMIQVCHRRKLHEGRQYLRLLMMDNARVHKKQVVDFLEGEEVKKPMVLKFILRIILF